MNYCDPLFSIKDSLKTKIALIDDTTGRKFTYDELQSKVKKLAEYFIKAGFKKDDIITMHLYNSAESVISHLAVQYAGLTTCLLDPLTQAGALNYYIKDTGSTILLTSVTRQSDFALLPDGITILKHEELPAIYDNEEEPDISDEPYNFLPEDITSIFYTSGTTSKPKGVMLYTKNYFSLVDIFLETCYSYTPDDTLLCFVPFSHGYGSKAITLPAFTCGATLVMMRSFQPQKIADAIENYGVNHIYGVPTHFQQLLRRTDLYDSLRKLKHAFCAAAKLRLETIKAWRDEMGIFLDEGYGLIETCTGVIFRTSEDPEVPGYLGGYDEKLITIEILDQEGNILPPGEQGEISVSGKSVMHGYLNKPEETANALQNGWFRTGDAGYKTEDKKIFMTGRIKDIINIAGIKISPYEVEAVINEHEDVEESAAVGIHHEMYGEAVKVFVRLKSGSKLTERELIKFSQKKLFNLQAPKEIEFCNDFPRNTMGKIDRKKLINKD